MEDLVDYSEDPFEGISVWTSPKVIPTSSFHFGDELTDIVALLPSISRPSCSTTTFSEATPSIPDLSTQPLSPSTLNFIDQSLDPSLGLSTEGLRSSIGSRILSASSISDPATPAPGLPTPISSLPFSGNFTKVTPISGAFPSNPLLGDPAPETNPTHDPPLNPSLDEGPHKLKKQRILRPKDLEVFLRLGEDFQWSEAMETTE